MTERRVGKQRGLVSNSDGYLNFSLPSQGQGAIKRDGGYLQTYWNFLNGSKATGDAGAETSGGAAAADLLRAENFLSLSSNGR
jgi:hypothetical protein